MLLQSDWIMDTILETSIHVLHYVQYAIDISHCFVMLFYMSALLAYIIINTTIKSFTVGIYNSYIQLI